ncbi:unnamed protein product [Arabis nemorensis]|uniref:Lsm14-like N-terminal domain-containing protein n=1 Tax=Arabis nemorensis TaxID=586526 RepID=A0A565CFG1_9BRAS|nr:unnamed protein product [Arabis nemorensis]
MDTENSQCLLSSSSSLPQQQNQVESYIGNYVTLISNCDLRYDGLLGYVNLQDWILVLQNGRGSNGFYVMPSNQVFEYIVFNGIYLKKILVQPSSTRYGYGVSPKGAKIHQKVPLISNENIEKPQATTDSEASSVNGSVNDRSLIASNPLAQPQFPGSYPFAQPQFPGSNYYDPRSLPNYGLLNQAPTNNASEAMLTPTNPSQSFFTIVPPNFGRYYSETVNQNFKNYKLWGPSRNNNQKDETARNPLDPIERPYHPFGPIERPLDYSEEIYNYIQSGF